MNDSQDLQVVDDQFGDIVFKQYVDSTIHKISTSPVDVILGTFQSETISDILIRLSLSYLCSSDCIINIKLFQIRNINNEHIIQELYNNDVGFLQNDNKEYKQFSININDDIHIGEHSYVVEVVANSGEITINNSKLDIYLIEPKVIDIKDIKDTEQHERGTAYVISTSVSPNGKATIILNPPGNPPGNYDSAANPSIAASFTNLDSNYQFSKWVRTPGINGEQTEILNQSFVISGWPSRSVNLVLTPKAGVTPPPVRTVSFGSSVSNVATLSMIPTGTIYNGDIVICTVEEITDDCYEFAQITIARAGFAVHSTQFTTQVSFTVDSNFTVTAIFNKKKFTLSLSISGVGGTLNHNSSTSCNCGETILVSSNPASGYSFDKWYGDYPVGHQTDPAISVLMDSDKAISATFAGSSVVPTPTTRVIAVAVNCSPIGAATPTITAITGGGPPYHVNDAVTFSVTGIQPGYTFKQWRLNFKHTTGELADYSYGSVWYDELITTTTHAYTIPNTVLPSWHCPQSPATPSLISTITATIEFTGSGTATNLTLTVSSAHATITKNPNQATYSQGSSIVLTVGTVDFGWSFTGWSLTAGTSASISSNTVTIGTSNVTITANFSQTGSLPSTLPHNCHIDGPLLVRPIDDSSNGIVITCQVVFGYTVATNVYISFTFDILDYVPSICTIKVYRDSTILHNNSNYPIIETDITKTLNINDSVTSGTYIYKLYLKRNIT